MASSSRCPVAPLSSAPAALAPAPGPRAVRLPWSSVGGCRRQGHVARGPCPNGEATRRAAAEGRRRRPRAAAGAAEGTGGVPEGVGALLFDCDGVLVDTERDGHRVSFNQAFRQKGLDGVEWDVAEYGELLKIGGGKERMTHYFNKVGWPRNAPAEESARKEFVAELHKLKTRLFMDLVETGALPLRPGVAQLIEEALAAGVKVAVCSTSNEKAVSAIVRVMLGPDKFEAMRIFAGDIVPRKKPDPAIYNLAASSLGVDPSRCVVVEDSHIGLSAAKAASMTCVVTTSGYTQGEDFSAADMVFPCIGDPPQPNFDLGFLNLLLQERNKQRVSSAA